MGAVEAKMFASEGAKVAIGDVLEEEGQRLVEEIVQAGGQAMCLSLAACPVCWRCRNYGSCCGGWLRIRRDTRAIRAVKGEPT